MTENKQELAIERILEVFRMTVAEYLELPDWVRNAYERAEKRYPIGGKAGTRVPPGHRKKPSGV